MKPLMTALFALALTGLRPDIEEKCVSSESFAILVSPRSVTAGETFRVLVASEKPLEGATLEAAGPEGSLFSSKSRSGGGPPYWRAADFTAGKKGMVRVKVKTKEAATACRELKVTPKKKLRKASTFVWKSEKKWDRGMENLFSAWIELLFLDAAEGASWNPLHEVMRNREDNLLHNYLGLGEDNAKGGKGLKMTPDCADNPFFLRAYFAWKLGLPFGIHKCSRGSSKKPPTCKEWITNHTEREEGAGDRQAFQDFLRTIMSSIHSGSARTRLADNITDLYPVTLTRKDLRPGVVFADPYGHTLTIIRWIPQTEKEAGLLLAVDAQPDGTIGIKRFWRGNFLFTTTKVTGEPGFKAFRPVAMKKGEATLMNNKEILKNKNYGNFSLQQKEMDPSAFYDTMDRLINPMPLDPVSAFHELHKAVHEQLLVRVTSVKSGEKYMAATKYKTIKMPTGPGIFQTSGPWEDYSTPSRDMRLLIALDVLLDFPEKVTRCPEAFNFPESKTPEQVKKELKKFHKEQSEKLSITYTKSNGAGQVLTLAEIIKRIEAFEMAYNPNDCVEIRWGSPEGSEEYSTCKRRAPPDQIKKMKSCREWFHTRTRPMW